MWTRKSIKSYAKDFLRKYYWQAFLVCLIASLLGGSNSASNSGNTTLIEDEFMNNSKIINQMNKGEISIFNNPATNFVSKRLKNAPMKSIARGAFPLMIIALLILTITIGYAIEVGKVRFFLRGFEGDANIRNVISTFNSEEYIGIVKTQFIRGLYTFLWTLLLVIPGIIKRYEYRMVPYIISENPNLSPSDAIEISRSMTYGHKMNIFILDLSFILWDLLGVLFFGIGGMFVNPYKEATSARLYNVLSGHEEKEEMLIGEDDLIFE